MEEKFPSLTQRLLNRSGSDSTRNTWSGEKLTSSLDSLPSFGTSPSSSSWADEVEDMLSSKSYASLFDSSLNSPSLPRTPPTPWTLADESCCPESDLLVISSHRGPGYHICMKEVSQGSVWDSHCHLDFLARKLNQVNIKGGESLVKSLQSDGQNMGERFGGCIANLSYCCGAAQATSCPIGERLVGACSHCATALCFTAVYPGNPGAFTTTHREVRLVDRKNPVQMDTATMAELS